MNQTKILQEIAASKFLVQHAPQFNFRVYEGLCPATKTEIHLGCFQDSYTNILYFLHLKRKQKWKRARSDPCCFRFSLFSGQLFISHKTVFFLHKFSLSGAFRFELCYPFL